MANFRPKKSLGWPQPPGERKKIGNKRRKMKKGKERKTQEKTKKRKRRKNKRNSSLEEKTEMKKLTRTKRQKKVKELRKKWGKYRKMKKKGKEMKEGGIFLIFKVWAFLFCLKGGSHFGLAGQLLGPRYLLGSRTGTASMRYMCVRHSRAPATPPQKKASSVKMLASARSATVHARGPSAIISLVVSEY